MACQDRQGNRGADSTIDPWIDHLGSVPLSGVLYLFEILR